jgi:hypothetical protein
LIITPDILVLAGREMLFLLIMFLTGIERSGNAGQEQILSGWRVGLENKHPRFNSNPALD